MSTDEYHYALNNMNKMLNSTYQCELDIHSSDIPGQST